MRFYGRIVHVDSRIFLNVVVE